MTINPLSSNMVNLLAGDQLSTGASGDTGAASGVNFADILAGTLNNASDMDTADKVSGLQLLMGQSDDLSGLMLDSQKAELSLNLALQIRNKVLDAYDQIMRMQV